LGLLQFRSAIPSSYPLAVYI